LGENSKVFGIGLFWLILAELYNFDALLRDAKTLLTYN